MKRLIFTFIVLMTFVGTSFSQNPSRISINGVVNDTLDQIIDFATVMLLNPVDSTLLDFTTSDENGIFEFKSVKNKDYLLKISHISYLPFQIYFKESANKTNNVGTLKLKPINQTLMEVVIKGAKAPLFIKGDTVEYDASTFKVAPGSTVEELLRRLPGIEIDVDGNITSQGKDVNKVYVDGKSFFGDDPKSVTKNLDAQIVSKVQVFDEKSEQSNSRESMMEPKKKL
ncbi:MAG: carboxypeptidase-like regulatory domain-containing protein [Saprospiraceae bacterium]